MSRAAGIFEFGRCLLDVERRLLFRDGKRVDARPQVFDVLNYLLAHADRVVTRDELFEAIWEGRFVSDSTLSVCIREIRQAVGDEGDGSRVIETVYAKGYRVGVPVRKTEAPAAAAPSAGEPSGLVGRELTGERKPVSLLFAALAHVVSSDLDAEARFALRRTFYELASRTVAEYGGFVHRTLEDGLMALFGAPVAQEDRMERALLAATKLRDEWATKAGPFGPHRAASVAVHDGTVVLGASADPQHWVVSSADGEVGILEELCRTAPPDSVVVSSAAYLRAVRGRAFEVLARPDPNVSDAYQVISVTDRRDATLWHDPPATPLVGRSRELALLMSVLDTVEGGRGQVVHIVGEPGVGKTRLLQELRILLDGRVGYLWTGCAAHASGTPYHPIVALLRRQAGLSPDDPPDVVAAKIRRLLDAFGLAREEAVATLLRLLHVDLVDDAMQDPGPTAAKTWVFDTILQMTALLSQQNPPMIFQVEDLHWIDESSRELLAALADRLSGFPILLLVSYRPGSAPPWTGHSYVSQLALTPLDRDESRCLLEELLGDLEVPPEKLDAVAARAEGNPLFIEALARDWRESGQLSGQHRLPDTIRSVLASRIDCLPADGKQLLQVASAIGREVPESLLLAVTEQPLERLRQPLDLLQQTELLVNTRPPPQATYRFKHELIREAAYESLLGQARREIHGRIADAIQTGQGNDVGRVPLLARHLKEAGRTAEAVLYHREAGEHALRMGAAQEATRHLTDALALLDTLPVRAERHEQELAILRPLSVAQQFVSGMTSSELTGILDRINQLDSERGDLSFHHPEIWMRLAAGDFQDVIDTCEPLLERAVREQNTDLRILVHDLLAYAHSHIGQYRLAIDHAQQVIAHYDPQQHRYFAFVRGFDPGVTSRSILSVVLLHRGSFDSAVRWREEAVHLARILEHPPTLCASLFHQGLFFLHARQFEAAHRSADEAMAVTPSHPFARLGAQIVRGCAAMRLGDVDAGAAEMERGMETWLAGGVSTITTVFRGAVAEACWHAGRIEDGLHHAEAGLEEVETIGERIMEAELHRLRGELLQRRSDRDDLEVEACFQRALAAARRLQAKTPELRAALSLGRFWHAAGKRAEARDLVARILGGFTEGFDSPDLQRARAFLATCP
jgi:DNA-binding winged helix-turn-helix (wHTH) protein/tetratricopeptide (TPR) repeat protein